MEPIERILVGEGPGVIGKMDAGRGVRLAA